MSKNNIIKPFGYELLLDCYDCDTKNICSIDACATFLEQLVESIGMEQQSPPFIFQSPKKYPEKAGLSGWVPLIESGIQIHTLTITNFVSLDIYCCRDLDIHFVKKKVKKFLNYSKVEMQYLERGKDYGNIYEGVLKCIL